MALQNDDLRREVERLRGENTVLRRAIETSVPSAVPLASRGLYRQEAPALSPVERVALGANGLQHFPVWLAVLLHTLTFGVFSIFYYAQQGARLPVIDVGDPSAAKAVGFFLIPYFNVYWLFAFPTRLADRLNLQLRLRGERPGVSQSLMVACAISTALILVPFLWVFAVVQIQRAINRIVALGPVVPTEAGYAQHAEFSQPAMMTGVRVDMAQPPPVEASAGLWAEGAEWEVDPEQRSGHR